MMREPAVNELYLRMRITNQLSRLRSQSVMS